MLTQQLILGMHRSMALAGVLALACAPPTLRLGDSVFLHTGRLSFLKDGQTTREDVLLRLGTPNAHFEGDRLLTYAFWKSSKGVWIRRGRSPAPGSAYTQPTDNLVLLFDARGILVRHSLVVAR